MNKPLISIELDDINSVPVITYKGERLTGGIVHVSFDYQTNDFSKHPTLIRLTTLNEVKGADGNNYTNVDTVSILGDADISGEDFYNSI